MDIGICLNVIKKRQWDDIDGVITAMKRVSDSNIEGLVLKYKKSLYLKQEVHGCWIMLRNIKAPQYVMQMAS